MGASNEPLAVDCVSDYLARLTELGLTDSEQSHVRWWFRGQPDQHWPLAPGVYRPAFPAGPGEEERRLRIEQQLFQDFRVLSAGLTDGPISDVELYFLLQHFGLPTRLLDWTTNPLAALYFTAKSQPDRDGGVVLMDAYQIPAGDPGRPWPVVTSDDPQLADWLAPVLRVGGKPADFAEFVVPIRPVLFNTRMRLQRACFTLHVPAKPRMTPAVNPSLRTVVVPGPSKARIYRELKLIGIDEFTIYGDLDNLAVSLKGAYGL